MPATKTKRYWCTRCESYQEFNVTSAMTRAGDKGFCEATVWRCKKCGFAPFLPPKPEGKEDGKERDNGNS